MKAENDKIVMIYDINSWFIYECLYCSNIIPAFLRHQCHTDPVISFSQATVPVRSEMALCASHRDARRSTALPCLDRWSLSCWQLQEWRTLQDLGWHVEWQMLKDVERCWKGWLFQDFLLSRSCFIVNCIDSSGALVAGCQHGKRRNKMRWRFVICWRLCFSIMGS